MSLKLSAAQKEVIKKMRDGVFVRVNRYSKASNISNPQPIKFLITNGLIQFSCHGCDNLNDPYELTTFGKHIKL